MKARISAFLKGSKPAVKELIENLKEDFPYVSVLGTDTFGTSYRVQRTGSSIGDAFWNERGFVVRVYNGVNYSEFSFNNIDEKNVAGTADEIRSKLKKQSKNLKGISLNKYPMMDEEEIKKSFIGEVKIHPSEVSAEDKINALHSIMDKALNNHKELVDFQAVYNELEISKIFMSTKKDLEQAYVISEGYVIPIVRRGNNTKLHFRTYSGFKGVELIDEMKKDIDESVKEAIQLLDAKPIEKPGEYDVICTPEISGILAHEAFGHGVEMDMFVKERAKAVNYIGKRVASDLVTMHDGSQAACNVSSYLFDDEGTLGKDTVIIKNGILERGMSDILSAMKLGTVPTGNGKRQSFERKAYARMTNTFFEPGNDNVEDMIASIKKGYLLKYASSGMEDPKNWGIQLIITMGYEIIDGKLTGKVIAPILVSGYVPDVLKSISMVSKKAELFGSGACGKGYKEYVKVSDGGPYLKTRVRLG